jgi:hypothetical protein
VLLLLLLLLLSVASLLNQVNTPYQCLSTSERLQASFDTVLQ